jgi:hypothetical protein
MAENGYPERTVGRRPSDTAHILKWIPVMSLGLLLLLQTIYVTRWGSGIETSNAQLAATVAELKSELRSLSAIVSSGAAPSAQMQLRIEFLERQANENRQAINDITRRISNEEARGRAGRER